MKIGERIKRLLLGQPPPTVEELAAHAEADSLPDRSGEAARLDAQLDAQRNAREEDFPEPF